MKKYISEKCVRRSCITGGPPPLRSLLRRSLLRRSRPALRRSVVMTRLRGQGLYPGGTGTAGGMYRTIRRMIDIQGIRSAQRHLGARVHRRPVLGSRTLGERIGATVLLKVESLQRTGSFKPRGVLNRLRHLSPEERQRGLVTVSAGNHAQAVAYAAGL